MKGAARKASMRSFGMGIFGRFFRGSALGRGGAPRWGGAPGAALGFALALGALALAACEQPFRAGLGQLVDIELPGIRLDRPRDGAFIRGEMTFTGESWDDLRVAAAQFRVTSDPAYAARGWDSLTEAEREELYARVFDWRDMDYLSAGSLRERPWRHALDTGYFRDGELRIRLRVSDGVEREGSVWVETEEFAFRVRNMPPAVSMILPDIQTWDGISGNGLGMLGGSNLNFFGTANLSVAGFERIVDSFARSITGIIRDERGVFMDAPAGGLSPPQFRLWEIIGDDDPQTPVYCPLVQLWAFPLGEPPLEGDYRAPWRRFGSADTWSPPPPAASDLPDGSAWAPSYSFVVDAGESDALFAYIFNDFAMGRTFGFQIRAQSVARDGIESDPFYFPRDEWGDFDSLPPEQQAENSFVAFRVRELETPPRVGLLRFEDISRPGGFPEKTLPPGMTPAQAGDIPHPYITDMAINAQSGPFTLRVWGHHTSGISEAMVLWTGPDGRRGRFIWDPVHDLGADPESAYTRWGLEDHRAGFENYRNFVFTYRGGHAGDRVPDETRFASLRGRYRIQWFAGTDFDWRLLYYGPTAAPPLPGAPSAGIMGPAGFTQFIASGHWRDATAEGGWSWADAEGDFSIRVHVRTPGGTPSDFPLEIGLTMDRQPPELELTILAGGAGTSPGGRHELANGSIDGVPAGAGIVSGVIRPRFFATDSRPEDSNFRVSRGWFARPAGGVAPEILFALVHDGDMASMEAYMAAAEAAQERGRGFWPLPPAASAYGHPAAGAAGAAIPDFGPGVSVVRHGVIHDNEVYIQTTRSHGGNRYDPLDDGLYWLHVFARDRAFNVRRESFPLVVDANADLPVIDFSVGLVSPAVGDPNLPDWNSAFGAANPGAEHPGGFVGPGYEVRGMLRSNHDIVFRVRDYDSLDIGAARIYFEGSLIRREGERDMVRPLSSEDSGYSLPLHQLLAVDGGQIFSPASGGGSPLRESIGTILQADLLRLLRESPLYSARFDLDGLNSLPDGKYRIVMYIFDDTGPRLGAAGPHAFKLSMPEASGGGAYEDVSPAHRRLEFWLAVDNQPPEVDRYFILPVNEAFIPLEVPTDITGTVWDDNGPITVRSFTVTRTHPTVASDVSGPHDIFRLYPPAALPNPPAGGWVELIREESSENSWEYGFTAWVDMERLTAEFFAGYDLDGIFDFELVFADRFGNPETVRRRHMMDYVSPTVSFTRPIETFSRPSAAGRHGISAENADRLANSVVSFVAHAHDNFIVTGMRWWLLPYDMSATPAGLEAAAGGGAVTNFGSFPAGETGALESQYGRAFPIEHNGSVVGAFGRIRAPGGSVYINTGELGLDSGLFRLHIVAEDVWRNHSSPDSHSERMMQEIFILQVEDRPYFSGISPSSAGAEREARGEHGLLITGTIMEDDGFGSLPSGSVRIWVSRSPIPPGDPLHAALSSGDFGSLDITGALEALYGWAGLDLNAGNGLLLSGRDIILNNIGFLDLFPHVDGSQSLFRDAAGNMRDGSVYYVLRARDYVGSKVQGPYHLDDVYSYQLFYFVLDSLPPEIAVEMHSSQSAADAEEPAEPRIFRENFYLRGHIADVNLARYRYSDYAFIDWRLTGAASRSGTLELRGSGREIEPHVCGAGCAAGCPHDGLEMSRFTVSADEIFAGAGGFGGLADGHYTLELLVVDMIGMANLVLLSFTVDTEPPAVSANFPGGANPAMTQAEFELWHGIGASWTDEQRRVWAAESALPVIYGGDGPALAGSIVDGFSDIALEDVRFRLNNEPDGVQVYWDGGGRNRLWEISLAGLDDGAHTLIIENVRDQTGNAADPAIFAFRLDSEQTALGLDPQPQNYRVLGARGDFDGDVAFTVTGAATGANLRGVSLRFMRLAQAGRELVREATVYGEAADWAWSPTASTLNWRYEFALEDFGDDFAPGGIYEIEVEALSWRAGGNSEPDFWAFAKDTEEPEIGFTGDGLRYDAANVGSGYGPGELAPDHHARNIFVGQTLVIQGTAADYHSDIMRVETRLEQWSFAAGAWQPVPARGSAGEGHWVQAAGANLTGSARNRNWRTENLAGYPVNLGSGLYRLHVRAMDSSWFYGHAADNFAYRSRGNPAESILYFYYDRGPRPLGFHAEPPQAMSALIGAGTGTPERRERLGFQVNAGGAIGVRHLRARFAGDSEGVFRVSIPVFALGMRDIAPVDALATANIGGREYRRENRLISVTENDVSAYLGRWEAANRFTLFVPAGDLGESRHTVSIEAEGLSGMVAELSRSVDVDNTPPSGSFASPELAAAAGGFEFSEPHLAAAGAAISGETFDGVGSMDSGIVRVDFRLGLISENAGSSILVMPTAERLIASYGDSAAGNDAVDGASGWHRLGAGLPLPAGFAFSRNLYSWELSVGPGYLLAMARSSGMSQPNAGLLEMPMWLRAVDGAGNAGYFHRVIRINPEADRPRNTIRNPAANTGTDALRGGNIFFEGVATIDNHDVDVNSVLYRVWVNRTGLPGDGRVVRDGYTLLTAAEMPMAAPASADDTAVIGRYIALPTSGAHFTGGNWFSASVEEAFVAPWNFNLNGDGRITALIPDGADYMRVRVEVVAINDRLLQADREISVGAYPGNPGDPQPDSRTFYITSVAPRILNPRVEAGTLTGAPLPPPAGQDWVIDNPLSGTFTIRATLDAGSAVSRISAVRILRPHETAHNGSLAHSNIDVWETVHGTAPNPGHNPEDPNSPDTVPNMTFRAVPWAGVAIAEQPGRPDLLDLAFTLNTTLGALPAASAGADWVRGGAWGHYGGEYHVEIRVYDTSTPPSFATLTLPIVIDNFAPVTDPRLRANPLQSGTGVFQGRVLDGAFGEARIDRIYAWFERSGAVHPAGTVSIGAARPLSVLAGRVAGFDPASADRSAFTVASGDRGAPPSGSFVIPAEAMEISGGTWGTIDGRANGQIWADSHSGRVVQWQFTRQTAGEGGLPDGPIALRYVVVDTAGNASLFEQAIVIRNNTPEIVRVVMHTALADTPPSIAVDAPVNPNTSMVLPFSQTAEQRARGYIDAGDFLVRNRWLGFTVDAGRGNAPLNFRAQHVTREEVELTAANVRGMIANRNSMPAAPAAALAGSVANVYTISRITGAVTPATWGILGVADPSVGAHFAFMPTRMSELWEDALDALPPAAADDDVGNNGDPPPPPPDPDDGLADLPIWVWRYTIRNEVPAAALASSGASARLNFGTGAFAPAASPVQAGMIPHFILSRDAVGNPAPGTGANQAGNPNRPFFLIRVWDSAIPAGHPGQLGYPPRSWNVNDQLHAALVVSTDIRLVDDERPTAGLHPLNTGFLTAVTGNNISAANRGTTIRNALNPMTMGGNATRGSLFNVGNPREQVRSGYIDPNGIAVSSGVYRDAVSGRIILRGRAHDNERIQSVQLRIGYGFGTAARDTDWFTILQWNGTADGQGRLMRVPAGADISATAAVQALVSADTVNFMETMHLRDGHSVEWAFLWDTEDFDNAAHAANVRVSVRARDASGAAATEFSFTAESGENANAAANNRVDIVPYITGFRRQERYATIRSMQGWHSFYQGETGIRALGWNLRGTPVSTGIGLAGLTNPLTPTHALATNAAHRANPVNGFHIGGRHMIQFGVAAPTVADATLTAGTHSGRINFTVGGQPIYNHVPGSIRPWDLENLMPPNDTGNRPSALWTNRPYAHVWRTDDVAATDTGAGAHIPRTFMGPFDNSHLLDHPGMALEYVGGDAGRLHGAWSVYGTAMVHYGTNQLGVVTGTSTRLTAGTPNDPFVMPDISMHRGTGIPNIAFVHMNDGNTSVRFRSLLNAHGTINAAATDAASLTSFPNLVAPTTATPTQRWQNIRTAKAGANTAEANPGVLYTSIYDAFNRSMVFIARVGTASTAWNIDGRTTGHAVVGNALPATAFQGGISRSTDAGLFSAVGFDGGMTGATATASNNPVVAYFDSANDTLRIAFGTGTGAAGTTWAVHNVLPAGHRLHGGSGRYVSMVVGRDGVIHLAFFNTRFGALVHTSGTRDNPASFGTNARIVDTMDGVGTWTDISLDHYGNPWIVYGYQGRQGNFDGVRVAYRSDSRILVQHGGAAGVVAGTASTQFSTPLSCQITGDITGWEAVQMAAPFRVAYDRLNIEAWPPNRRDDASTTVQRMADAHREGGAAAGRAWSAAIGYVSGAGDNRFRIGYFFLPTGGFSGNR